MKNFALPIFGFILATTSLSALSYPLYDDPISYRRGLNDRSYDRNYYYQDSSNYSNPSSYNYSNDGYYYNTPSNDSYYYSTPNSRNYSSTGGYQYQNPASQSYEDNVFFNSSTPGYSNDTMDYSQTYYQSAQNPNAPTFTNTPGFANRNLSVDVNANQGYYQTQNAMSNRTQFSSEQAGTMTAQDTDLSSRIRRAIQNEPGLSSSAQNINVQTAQGKVILEGSVASDAEKNRVENFIKQINGVKTVDNKLTVASNR